jgi:cellulose synthase/poly-beta-1,6-N-acetylglucosamine synthase-like glycosyltransferase
LSKAQERLNGSPVRALWSITNVQTHVNRLMLIFVLGVTVFFGISLILYLRSKLIGVDVSSPVLALIIFKAAIEVWCSLYAGYFVFISLYYLGTVNKRKRDPGPINPAAECPSLAIVYVCCGDLEKDCLESLCETKTNGPLKIFVHDDSREPEQQQEVDNAARELAQRYGVDLVVLRRGNREGGKPGALNFVLKTIPESFEWMLLCDNDSRAIDKQWYLRVAPMLQDEKLGCVQFRNLGTPPKSSSKLLRRLLDSINVFEVFVAPAEKFGWMPFFGHNAVLRLSAIREVGGFQPGEFADDIDVSIRLNLKGYNIQYRQDITFSEDHPENYRAFRARSYKWAYGCASVLRRWGGTNCQKQTAYPPAEILFLYFYRILLYPDCPSLLSAGGVFHHAAPGTNL